MVSIPSTSDVFNMLSNVLPYNYGKKGSLSWTRTFSLHSKLDRQRHDSDTFCTNLQALKLIFYTTTSCTLQKNYAYWLIMLIARCNDSEMKLKSKNEIFNNHRSEGGLLNTQLLSNTQNITARINNFCFVLPKVTLSCFKCKNLF